MRHHVVAHLALALRGRVIVDVGDVRSELVDLRLHDGQTQLMLRAGQLHPEPPPCLKAHVR